MWRKSSFAGNHDSDQSISEEEDLASHWPEDCISLGGSAEKKEGIRIQSQLEILRARDISDQKHTGFAGEDDVEIPVFWNDCDSICYPRRASMCITDNKITCNEEVKFQKVSPRSFGSQKGDMACTWSAITREAQSLFLLNENVECSSSHADSSKLNKLCQGSRAKGKRKFSFRLQSSKEDLPWSVNRNDDNAMSYDALPLPGELETIDHRSTKDSTDELLDNLYGEKIEQEESFIVADEVAVRHDIVEHSMAEILDDYQEKNGLLRVKCNMSCRIKGRRGQLVKRSSSTWGNRSVDDADLYEALDSGPSSEDEEYVRNKMVASSEIKGKAMVDQFQETLGAACMNDKRALSALPRQSCSELFGKLQHVIRSEKDKDMNFLKKLQTGASSNSEVSCLDVKILSRCLEAKLTVCRCFIRKSKERYHCARSCLIATEYEESIVTVIFNSRLCNDVELEAGNLIRIYSPWNEVQYIGRDEKIFLSTYFSQIST